MNEAEWLCHDYPLTMLNAVQGRVSDRKLRLFACACARRIWDLLTDPRSREAVYAAELYADGEISFEEMSARHRPARQVSRERKDRDPDDPMQYVLLTASDITCRTGSSAASSAVIDAAWQRHKDAAHIFADTEHPAQAELLRDIAGYPFRTVHFDPVWRSSTVTALANLIYTERRFDRMPVLADALEEVGCGDPDILAHCRGDGPHARGCWVVDLVLGRG